MLRISPALGGRGDGGRWRGHGRERRRSRAGHERESRGGGTMVAVGFVLAVKTNNVDHLVSLDLTSGPDISEMELIRPK